MKTVVARTRPLVELFDELVSEPCVAGYLESLAAHHEESHGHSLRVGLLCLDLGLELDLEPEMLGVVGRAGLLHDIGKLHIPREVLCKFGLLDPAEKAVMQEHSRAGFVELNGAIDPVVRRIVVAHHEFCREPYPRRRRQDPPPVPERRKGERRVHNLAELVAATDMFDALIHRRGYKRALLRSETETALRHQFTGDERYIAMLLRRAAW